MPCIAPDFLQHMTTAGKPINTRQQPSRYVWLWIKAQPVNKSCLWYIYILPFLQVS